MDIRIVELLNKYIEILNVEDGKIVEHWDVIQAIPEKSANSNTML